MNRIFTLDYLRGIASLCILIYHFFSFKGYELDSTSILDRIGIYGVSIFYILSGLTLYFVYNKSLTLNKVKLKKFFIKRSARILPLLWVVTLGTIILTSTKPSSIDLFLNLTGLFSLFKWDTYIATGAWSIGNELVFYLFFPIFLILSNRNEKIFKICCLLVFCISIYFSFKIIPFAGNDWWSDYVNPLNQLIYFISGIVLGKYLNFEKKRNNLILFFIVAFATMIFCTFPSKGDSSVLVKEYLRYIFWLLCLVIVGALYLLKLNLPNSLHKSLLFFGEISYSLYLFHPLVYFSIGFISRKTGLILSNQIYFLLMFALTIIVSYLSYEFFEKKIVRWVNKQLNTDKHK